LGRCEEYRVRIFIDAEFHEQGHERPIELISLALVSDSGNELYLVNSDYDWGKCGDAWLLEHVLKPLHTPPGVVMPYGEMASHVESWVARCNPLSRPSFWGYYSDYDWVVFCQLFGRMVDLPKKFPKYCMDIKQLCVMMGNPDLPAVEGEHNALVDARWNKAAWEFLMTGTRTGWNMKTTSGD
jgi:hypothetical protein